MKSLYFTLTVLLIALPVSAQVVPRQAAVEKAYYNTSRTCAMGPAASETDNFDAVSSFLMPDAISKACKNTNPLHVGNIKRIMTCTTEVMTDTAQTFSRFNFKDEVTATCISL